jgi:hypothetical protein
MDSSNYRVGRIPVLQTDASPPTAPEARYEGLNPRTIVLPVGYKKEPDCRSWDTETVFEQDIPIPLRDGVIIRADVFRPARTPKVPAIVHYSPYGKSGTGQLAIVLLRACDRPILIKLPLLLHFCEALIYKALGCIHVTSLSLHPKRTL